MGRGMYEKMQESQRVAVRMSVVLANWGGGGESPFVPEKGEYATPICLHERPTTHLPPHTIHRSLHPIA